MLQHPSATRSVASLGRSIPMPARQVYPLAPCIFFAPSSRTPCRPTTPIPPLLHSVLSTVDFACYVSGRTTSTLPLHLYCQPSIPSFHLSRPGHRRLLSVTSRAALLCASLNSYRRSVCIYVYLFICMYACIYIYIYSGVSIANNQRHRCVLHANVPSPLIPTLHLFSLSHSHSHVFSSSALPAVAIFSIFFSCGGPTVPPLVADLINAKEFLVGISRNSVAE